MRSHRVTWDEAKIREYEESKPLRQKITEPKTPYHPMIDADNGAVSPLQNSKEFIDNSAHAEALIRALNEVASSSHRHFGGWTSSEDEVDDDLDQDEDSIKDKHGESFRERRRASYEEFGRLKELKSIVDDELSDEVREIEIQGSGESLRTIVIEGSEETAQDVEILEGDLLASTAISSDSTSPSSHKRNANNNGCQIS